MERWFYLLMENKGSSSLCEGGFGEYSGDLCAEPDRGGSSHPTVFSVPFSAGENFQTEMYLKITGKMQKCTVGILGGILLALALWCLVTKADKVTVLYNLPYYTVFIAFAEEFVVRAICVYLVRGEEPYIPLSGAESSVSRSCIFFPMRTGERSQCLM